MVFFAAALTLITVGVFAGKSKFQAFSIYVSKDATTFFPLVTSGTQGDVQTTTNGAQITVTDHAGTVYLAYYGQNASDKLYSTSAW